MRLGIVCQSKRNFSLIVIVFSLLILSFYTVLGGLQHALGSDISQPEGIGINIELSPSSESMFFDCGVTTANGTTSLRGMSANESARSALMDRNLDTLIMGKAIFGVSSSKNDSIVNIPGPDLMVVEMGGAERMNASIFDSEAGKTKWLIMRPTPSNNTNNCNMVMNQLLVDLSSFGVSEGTAVPSVRFDNLGRPNALRGSDIAEIFILDSGTSGTTLSSEITPGNSSYHFLSGIWFPKN